jgi:hypothetical protein
MHGWQNACPHSLTTTSCVEGSPEGGEGRGKKEGIMQGEEGMMRKGERMRKEGKMYGRK